MNDKEMAFELGKKLINLQEQVEVLEGVMMEFRVTGPDGRKREPRWRESAELIASEPGFLQLRDERLRKLRDALEGTSDATTLKSLFQTFCRT